MLNRETFDEFVLVLGELKQWKLSERTQTVMYDQVCELVNDLDFVSVADNLMEQDFVKPDAVVRACREHRRIQRNATPPPALPPALPPAAPAVCDEQIKFHRLGDFLRQRKVRGCHHEGGCRVAPVAGDSLPHCYCWAEVWATPLTEDEHRTFASSPIAHPLAAVLGGVPQPDPKENHRHAA